MAKTKVYESVRYHTLNENNQIESDISINKLSESTFTVFGSEYPVQAADKVGTLKKVTLTISVEDYIPKEPATAESQE
ncbi:hypothetical protein [Moraxella pluranimalium]|uniref:Uncharacterized protein n=1 Tax=Moraxella pluranimalium TaxID=470453 RepID=A0A1T0CC76_9GAMM|nr:hypothetical protein [Moraxella pluranimalium]OOS19948.1 hypothetical protein B0680_10580 [Moraxella pluranimalium]